MKQWFRVIRKMWSTFVSWLHRIFAREVKPYQIMVAQELPDVLLPKILYLLSEAEPWQGAMLCPCGCKVLIQLSLLHQDSPHWRFIREFNGTPTITPSIRRTTGCCSHFFLRYGMIIWCDDPERMK